MHSSEFYGYFLITAMLMFANTGGIGGGGIIISIMIGIFRFDTRSAVSLSNASMTVSTVTRNITNINKSHPLKLGAGTLHDYNITLLMFPGIVIGASLGSIVNLSLPGPIICAGFIIGNFFVIGISVRTYRKIRKTESISDQKEKIEVDAGV